jgi:serine/threonine protein kinase
MRIALSFKGILIFCCYMEQTTTNPALPEIKDFEIISKIGQGGIAEIYKAKQISLNRHVAIKVLFPELMSDPDIVKRFDRESTTIAGLNHPNIVHVIDKGKAGDSYYFVMEYVDGTSFRDIIYSQTYTVRQKLGMIVDVLKGLDYAHKNGVIHRDIKPANILVDRQGNVLVADFGIAHLVGKPEHEMTSSDVVMGTVAYMAPEQRVSAANVTPATDIFAIGLMIYEILAGDLPQGRFKLPSEINPKISRRFDEIIARCLAQDPAERYQKAVQLKDDLLNIISGHSQAAGSNQTGYPGVESFIGKSQFLDTLKETKYSSTMLVENKESHELFVIKKNSRSSTGLKEAKLLASLKHKNIINVLGAGGDDKRLVVVMEYAPGGSLADRMVKPYPFDRAMEIIIAIADALDFASRNGIIHGNLRPSNILFTNDETVKVSDFGLPPHYSLMEKNWYAAPEKRVSKQGDVYGLGVILHQMLFGKNPVYNRSSNLFLGRVNHIIPAAMERILGKLLAIRVSQRYRGIEEFLLDWDEYQKSVADSEKVRMPKPPVNKFARNRKTIAIAAAVGLVSLIVVLALVFSGLLR